MFWLVLGPHDLGKYGYVRSGRLWRGTDLPRGVFETWKRWCLKPSYFLKELLRVQGADPVVDLQRRSHRHAEDGCAPADRLFRSEG